MKISISIIVILITISSMSKCQENNDTMNKTKEEFIDVSRSKINPYKDNILKESFPPVVKCETVGSVYEMFFYNNSFLNCAPAYWVCEYRDSILLPNKTMADCYNRRNFAVACLYGGFKAMPKCRNNHKKCGINYFNCKEKIPRTAVEYSDKFLYQLGKAIKSKNITIDTTLLEKIKQADDRRILNNITETEDYHEDTIMVGENELSKEDYQALEGNFTIDNFIENLTLPTDNISLSDNEILSNINNETVISNQIENSTVVTSTSLNIKDYLSDNSTLHNINNDTNISGENFETYLNDNITTYHNTTQEQTNQTFSENSQIMVVIKNFYSNPIKNIAIIILCLIISIILVFICCKICGKATYVYEVAEHQRLMDISVNSRTFKNESFDPNDNSRRKNQ